jgi:hypothetical protein
LSSENSVVVKKRALDLLFPLDKTSKNTMSSIGVHITAIIMIVVRWLAFIVWPLMVKVDPYTSNIASY